MESPVPSNAAIPQPVHLIAPEFFRAIAECTYDWESWQNVKGDLMWVNSAVERFSGYTTADYVAMVD